MLFGEGDIGIRDFDYPRMEKGTLLRNIACGICGTDDHLFKGVIPVHYPLIMGHELVSTVEEICHEEQNSGIQEGDTVTLVPVKVCGECYYCKTFPQKENLCINRREYGVSFSCTKAPHLFGGFSEITYVEPGHTIIKLPKELSNTVGVLVEPIAVSFKAITIALGLNQEDRIKWRGKGNGITLGVQGAGPIGILVGMVAKLSGCRVITMDLVKHRLQAAQIFGADDTVNITDLGSKDVLKKVLEFTGNTGVDVLVECTGDPHALEQGIDILRRGGKYVIMGNSADMGSSKISLGILCRNDISITSSLIASTSFFHEAIEIMTQFNFPWENLLRDRFSLSSIEKGLLNVELKRGIKNIVVLK